MRTFEISVRSLVEFILRSGDIESGFLGGMSDPERALLGTRLHQKLQKKEGGDYQKEIPFTMTVSFPGAELKILGRADGIFTLDVARILEEKELRSAPQKGKKRKKSAPLSLDDIQLSLDAPQLSLHDPMPGFEFSEPEKDDSLLALENSQLALENSQLALRDGEMSSSSEDDFDLAVSLVTEGVGHGEVYCVDEIKSTGLALSKIHPDTYPLHFAQGAFYAYMLLQEKEELPHIFVRVTYIHVETEEVRHFYRLYTREALEKLADEVITSYGRFIEWKTAWDVKRQEGLAHLGFPFDAYRKGQKEMMDGIEKAIRTKTNLFLQAPTGIGKTMSALLPSLTAMEEGEADMIFYLTCKNVTGTVALEALDLLKQKNEKFVLKELKMTAKETICPLEKCECHAADCPYAHGHFNRINEAVITALNRYDRFEAETVLKLANEFMVCPHELELDISSWCDLVIADVNYAFDPSAKLKRFFQTGGKQPYLLLVDEAHNLVERARDMFSADLSTWDLSVLKKGLPPSPGLKKALSGLDKLFKDAAFLMGDRLLLRGSEESEETASLGPAVEYIPFGEEAGSFVLNAMWKEAVLRLTQELKSAFEMLAQEGSRADDAVSDAYFRVLFFERILEDHEDGYEIYLEKKGRSIALHLFCVDPSKPIQKVTSNVLSCVFFSATLEPTAYFTRLLGKQAKDTVLELSSPFDRQKRIVMTAGIPQTFRQRERSLPLTAEMIRSFIEGKEGRYMAFLPSFRYLEQLRMQLQMTCPSLAIMVQESGMSHEERTALLAAFRQKEGTVLMLNVLGGVFSEGIDLTGEQLIGAVIVSAALPQIGPERDLIKTHFDDEGASFGEEPSEGFRIAYTYPGMNRVLQAAGRVIRTEKDTGAILLIDDRFESKTYERLFPEDYQDHIPVTSETLPAVLHDFWNRME